MAKCIVCRERKAEVPDRYAMSNRARVCRECHRERLRKDMAQYAVAPGFQGTRSTVEIAGRLVSAVSNTGAGNMDRRKNAGPAQWQIYVRPQPLWVYDAVLLALACAVVLLTR